MFALNDSLQPLQVSQGPAAQPATCPPGSSMQTGLFACTVGCVCACAPPLGSTFPPFWSLPPQRSHCSQSSFFLCMSHSPTAKRRVERLRCSLTVRGVGWWLTHSLQQTWNQTKTLITPCRVWLTPLLTAAPMSVCVAVSCPSSARTASEEATKMNWSGGEGESLLAQMLLVMVVHVAQTLPPPSAAETGFSRLRALRKYFFFLPQSKTRPAAERIGECF